MKKFFCILIVILLFFIFVFNASADTISPNETFGLEYPYYEILRSLEHFHRFPHSMIYYNYELGRYTYVTWNDFTTNQLFYADSVSRQYAIYNSYDLVTWELAFYNDNGSTGARVALGVLTAYRDGINTDNYHILYSSTDLWFAGDKNNPFFLQGANPFPKEIIPVVGLKDFFPVFSEVSQTLSTVLPVSLLVLAILLGVSLILYLRVFLR